MTTDTIAAPAAAKARMSEVLAEKKASNAFFDMLRSGTASARKTAEAGFRAARLDKLKGLALAAASFAREQAVRFLVRPARYFGWVDLLGTVLTGGALRDGARKVLSTAYRVVRYPIAKALRALTWLPRKTKWGATACAMAEGSIAWCEQKVADLYTSAEEYLDRHENSRVMSFIRGIFQARMIGKAVRLFFPKAKGWMIFLVFLVLPVFGQRKGESAVNTERMDAVRSLRDMVRKGKDVVEEATAIAEQAAEAAETVVETKAEAAPEAPKVEALQARLTVPWRGLDKNAIITLESWVSEAGERCYRYDGTTYVGESTMKHLELGWVEPVKVEAKAPAKKPDPGHRMPNRGTARQAGAQSAKKTAARTSK